MNNRTRVFLKNKNNEILFIIRKPSRERQQFKILFPGGGKKFNEDEADCGIREIKEELKLKLKKNKLKYLFHIYDEKYDFTFYEYEDILLNEEVINNEPENFSEVVWLKLENVNKYISDNNLERSTKFDNALMLYSMLDENKELKR
jgi:8-oxo-dGTP pyrophosphatase MutT (NUDIX family)